MHFKFKNNYLNKLNEYFTFYLLVFIRELLELSLIFLD